MNNPSISSNRKSIDKLLIANRGEIACRIIHSAKKLGIKTVAIYSTADTHAKHVALADEAYYIGEAAPKESYLQGQRIIELAKKVGAQAIHPGYGFLSENADFSKLCEENQIIFIGPSAESIKAMGLKSEAKARMEAAKVPLVPGYHGDDQSIERLTQSCKDIGFPVLLKASAGGGGKGMRVIESLEGIAENIAAAQREGLNSFADGHLLAEKYLKNPRHIEIQLFCDQQGNGVYLFERDCSIQRRHQKIVEEAPAPNFPDHIRKAMGEAALQAAKAINYVGAGTVEFLYENGEFYFMEMNTRLQVEHPVSEYISGQDLVAWQIKVAQGEPLPVSQEDLKINGHAIEVRLYAEDPYNDFLPTAGKIDEFIYPANVSEFDLDYDLSIRMDTGVRSGDQVSPFYDPMIAKLIVWGEDRKTAINKLKQTLLQTHITGLTNNVRYLEQLISLDSFSQAENKNSEFDTHFIEKNTQAILEQASLSDHDERLQQIFCAYFLYQQRQTKQAEQIFSNDGQSPWNNKQGWRLNSADEDPIEFISNDPSHDQQLIRAQFQTLPSTATTSTATTSTATSGKIGLLLNGHQYQISCLAQSGKQISLRIVGTDVQADIFDSQVQALVIKDQNNIVVHNQAGSSQFSIKARLSNNQAQEQDEHGLQAPMNGCLTEIKVSSGDKVKAGDSLIIMEAMKMEHIIKAPHDGTISEIFFSQGDLVEEGCELISYE